MGPVVDRTVAAVVVPRRLAVEAGTGPTGARWTRSVQALGEAGVDLAEVGDELPRLATPSPRRAGGRWSGPPGATVTALLARLAVRGVGPGLLLLAGDLAPGGRDAAMRVAGCGRAAVVALDTTDTARAVRDLLALVEDQLERRARGRVDDVDRDPAWTRWEDDADVARRRVAETLLTVAAGGFGTRGALEDDGPGRSPLVLADGIHTGAGAARHLLAGPDWTGLALDAPPGAGAGRRVLDLRTGVLHREVAGGAGPPTRTLRFASIARPGIVVLCAEASGGRLHAGPPLRAPHDGAAPATGIAATGDEGWVRTGGGRAGAPDAGLAAVAVQHEDRHGPVDTLTRIAAYVADPAGPPALAPARRDLAAAVAAGPAQLLDEQRAAWARRWASVDVRIPGDPDAQDALRFALFHLWGAASGPCGAVGARGVTGPGYAGHVFWDADVFVAPALASIDPRAARAITGFRRDRLDAARARARATGYAGARFPWESADAGTDVTPTAGYVGGRPVAIRTGSLEDHVTAGVAWSAHHVDAWTGAPADPRGPARALLVETARFWASRIREDAAGTAHVDHVIGPDEYHEDVDDDAYTNVMARWNLRRAADVLERAGEGGPATRRWRRLAERLVDGHDPHTGRHEQFAGYDRLAPLTALDIGQVPVAADVLLGPARLAATGLVKQPDVLMLHHLVPEEMPPGSLAADLDRYVPRTAHGSSLSPAITAAVLARAGRVEQARSVLGIALRLDLDDLTGTTAAGLHLATLGGLWQAVLAGVLGARVRAGVLALDPRPLPGWEDLAVRFRCLGRRVRVVLLPGGLELETDGPLSVTVFGRPARPVRRRLVTHRDDPGRGWSA